MKSLFAVTLVVAVVLIGLTKTNHLFKPVAPPTSALVTGVVRYPSGHIVWRAKLTIITGVTTFTDSLGVYQLTVPISTDSLTIHAWDGYTPGAINGVFRSATVRVRPDHDRVLDNILDHVMPV